MRALIVDDSRPIRRIEGEILSELGFDTYDACHGKEALERLQNEPRPDVILVDWNMPEMDGLEFIKAVRRDGRYSGMVILMVTTETEPEQMLRAFERRSRRVPHEAVYEGRTGRQTAARRRCQLVNVSGPCHRTIAKALSNRHDSLILEPVT